MIRTLFAFVLLGVACGAEVPPDVAQIQKAATRAGLLTDADFSTHQALNPADLKRRSDQLSRPQIKQTMDQEPYVEETLLRNYPFTIGVHKTSGFRLTTYFSDQQIMLLAANAPLVNGGEKEATDMIETMLDSAEALLPSDKGLRKWLNSAWQESWKAWAKWNSDAATSREAQSHPDLVAKEIVKKRQVGSFLVIVWGVPPDIVFLNCVRVPATKSSRRPLDKRAAAFTAFLLPHSA